MDFKFKIGQRVNVHTFKGTLHEFKDVGVIVNTDDSEIPYYVRTDKAHDGVYYHWLLEEELTEMKSSNVSKRSRSSRNYVGTVSNSGKGWDKIYKARKKIKEINKALRANGTSTRYRVEVKGRLGKDNDYAYLYRRGGKYYRSSGKIIYPEHAKHFDLYVYYR